MLDETEACEVIRNAVDTEIQVFRSDTPALVGATLDGLPESESGFTLTLADGTKFLVNVTKIEEGQG